MMLLAPAVADAQINQTNQTTQTVRGQVRDVASDEPMIGVTITIENGMTMGSVTDADGNFEIKDVPVGRHSVRATYIGYEPVLLKEQLVTSGKELVITLKMRESISELGEVVIKPRVNKQQPLNEMAQVGARMFSGALECSAQKRQAVMLVVWLTLPARPQCLLVWLQAVPPTGFLFMVTRPRCCSGAWRV